MAKQQKKLGEILVEWGFVQPKEVDKALAHAKAKNLRIGEALLDLKLCTENHVYKALAQQSGMEYIDLDKSSVPPNAVNLVPDDLMRKHLILPLGKENGRLRIAIHDPLDLELLDILRFRLNTEIRTVLASKSRIKGYLDELFNTTAQNTIDKTLDKTIDKFKDSLDKSMDKSVDRSIDKSIDVTGMDEAAMNDPTQAPIIKLVQAMIAEAVRNRASDIHIEPMKDRIRVRYRIDGECVERDRIPLRMKGPLISRLKIMAGIDIAEKRLPQDGRIKMTVDKAQIDFRVSSLPAYHGESVVLRILRPDSVRIGIQNMGFEEEDYKQFQKIIKRPNGIFLVTGPTGSGKTTTLYGALNELNRPDRKIITAEDPVEYNSPGINQVEVKHQIGLDFARIIRAMLRQAPNIILVGEIRDKETAEIAVQASLTGHLVFSTLHTNDAPSAITRLSDIGVQPFLIASSVVAIMAQRLVRVTCTKCKEPDDPPASELRAAGITPEQRANATFMRGRGCNYCHHTGYRGRLGIFELLRLSSGIREMTFNRAPTQEIRRQSRVLGMRTLLEDGVQK